VPASGIGDETVYVPLTDPVSEIGVPTVADTIAVLSIDATTTGAVDVDVDVVVAATGPIPRVTTM
jgi:hypothetical protein